MKIKTSLLPKFISKAPFIEILTCICVRVSRKETPCNDKRPWGRDTGQEYHKVGRLMNAADQMFSLKSGTEKTDNVTKIGT